MNRTVTFFWRRLLVLFSSLYVHVAVSNLCPPGVWRPTPWKIGNSIWATGVFVRGQSCAPRCSNNEVKEKRPRRAETLENILFGESQLAVLIRGGRAPPMVKRDSESGKKRPTVYPCFPPAGFHQTKRFPMFQRFWVVSSWLCCRPPHGRRAQSRHGHMDV